MIELDEIMRQHGDSEFCELLCRIRTADHTDGDLAALKSREVTSDMPNYPNHALHVYRLNTDVDDRNSHILNAQAPKSQQYSTKACDSMLWLEHETESLRGLETRGGGVRMMQ